MINKVLIFITLISMWQSELSYSQKISIDSIKTCTGEQAVLVPIQVGNLNNIGAITLYIDFDTTVLKFDSIININSKLPGTLANKIPNKPQIGIVWSATNSGADLGADKFCDLRFTVKKPGLSTLSFDAACEIVDFNADIINVIYKNGNVDVNPLPVVSFAGLNQHYCIDAGTVQLIGTPAGGTFSGDGISGTGFNAALAGSGIHEITYSYSDVNGCYGYQMQTVTVNQNLVVTITPDNPAICNGGSVELTAHGASTYMWSNGQTTSSIIVSPTATTTYTVMGMLGTCTATQTVQVTVNQNLVVTITPDNPSLCSGGSVELTAHGASTYMWNNGETTSSIIVSPTSTAIYAVAGSTSGCQDTAAIRVTVNPLPVVTANVSASSIAGSDTTWTIKNSGFTFNPSSISITYGDSVRFQLGSIHNAVEVSQATWNANDNTPLAGGFSTPFGGGLVSPAQLVIGTHYYVCAPHAGMGMKGIITVTASSYALCAGSNITLSGGGANSYSWSDGVSDGIGFIPTATNTYTVTGTDANGCSNTQSVRVIVVPNPVVTITPSDSLICSGGLVTLAGHGASTYMWNNGQTTSSITVSPTSTATYTVIGKNTSGCTASKSVQVTVNQNLVVTITPDNPSICNGGSVELTAHGASAYIWNNGETTSSIIVSPTATATYSVTGTLSTCTATQTVQVTVNQNLVVTITPDNPAICNGGSVELTAHGASAYMWSNGETTSSIIVSPTATRTYTVMGMLGTCTATQTVQVTVNQNLVVTITPDNPAICNGGSVELTAHGASAYMWSNGETTSSIIVSPTATRTYTVMGMLGTCTATQTVQVTVNQNLVVTITPDNPAICNGGSVELTAHGASTYIWNNGETTSSIIVSPTATATYSVTGTLSTCTATQTVQVAVNQNLVVTITPDNPSLCSGGSVELTADGASTYMWSNGQTTSSIIVSPTATTTYTVMGMLGTCTATQTVQVTVNQNLVVTITPDNPAICNGGSVELMAHGASTYMWSNGQTTSSITVSPTSTATYTVIGKNTSGCTATQTVQVAVNQNLVVTITPDNPSLCSGGSVELTADGASTYMWSNGQTTSSIIVSPTATTTYTVMGMLGTCTATQTVQVTVNQNLVVTITPDNPAICNGGSVELMAHGASTYMWSNGQTTSSITVSPTSTATYTVIGKNTSGCTATQTVQVTVNQNLVVTITPDNPSICSGGSVQLTAHGASTYMWSNGQTTSSITVSPTSTATYTVIGKNTSGCTVSKSVQVTVNQNLVVTITPDNPAICNGGSVELMAHGASTYMWSNGQTTSSITVSPTSTATYTVIGKNTSGCTANKSMQVVVNQNPSITITPVNPRICRGGSVILTAQGATTYLWSNGQTTSSIIVFPTSTTTYTVIGTRTTSCQNIATTTVIVNPSTVTVNAGTNKSVYVGYTPLSCTTLAATGIGGGTPGYSLLWSSGATTSSITVCPVMNTKYSVTVTDTKGCKAKDSVQVCVKDIRCQVNKVKICGTFILFGNVIGRQTYCLPEATATILLSLNNPLTTWNLGPCGSGNACDFGLLAGKTELTEEDFGQEHLTAEEYALIYGSASVKLYPNPSNNSSFVNIEMINVPDKSVQVTVTNIMGQVLVNEKIAMNEQYVKKRLNFYSDLTPGTYIVSVITDATVITEKLIVQ